MQLILRSLDKNILLEVDQNDSINDLKKLVEDHEFIPSELQILHTGCKILESGLIKDNLQELDTVEMNLELKGGMRQKWKKKRIRRQKRMRRRMRLRAR